MTNSVCELWLKAIGGTCGWLHGFAIHMCASLPSITNGTHCTYPLSVAQHRFGWQEDLVTCHDALVGCFDDDDAKKWQEQCSRWGLGFERVATVPVDDHHHSSGRGRYSCTSPCLVAVRTRAGAHRLVVGAEVDAFDGAAARAHGDDGSAPLRTTAALVELKTHGAARRLPDAKLARVWVQEHLAGVPAVVDIWYSWGWA